MVVTTSEQTAARAKTLERIRAFRLIDDDFMQACFQENIPCTELVLRIIMGKPDLVVKSVRTQKMLKSLGGHSICLDIAATDSEGREFDIEIQRRDDGAIPRRARYILSLMDAAALREGEDFRQLPETILIFITEHDVFKGGLPLYSIDRRIAETGQAFGDGAHIIYVNGEMQGDGTDLEKLMHDFFCTDPEKMYFEPLRKVADFFKTNEKGVGKMSRIMEEVREEGWIEGKAEGKAEGKTEGKTEEKMETALRMLKKGLLPLEDIGEYTGFSLDEIRKIAATQQGCAS